MFTRKHGKLLNNVGDIKRYEYTYILSSPNENKEQSYT